MADSPANDAFRELVARGRLASTPEPLPLSVGNVDRREPASRASWVASRPDGRKVRVVLGPALDDLVRRHSAFAAVAPGLISAPVFHERLSTAEAFACDFFAGEPIEAVARSQPSLAQNAFTRLCTALAATEKSSPESARLAEWQAWTAGVEGHEFWTAPERQLLREVIWPASIRSSARHPPRSAGPTVISRAVTSSSPRTARCG